MSRKNSQSEMRVASLLYFCNKIGSTAQPPRNTNPGNSLLLCSEKTKTERKREREREREKLWSCFGRVGMDNVLHKLRKLDAYPKINEDFYSRTFSGGLITLVSFIVIFLLFFSELSMLLSLSLSLSLKIYLFIFLKLCEF